MTTVLVSLAIYGPVYGLTLRRLAGEMQVRAIAILSTWLVATYLVLTCMQFQPWFAVWPITLGIWVDDRLTRRVLLAFNASTLLSYAANFLWNCNIHLWSYLQVNAMFVTIIYMPPVVVLGWRTYRRAVRSRIPE